MRRKMRKEDIGAIGIGTLIVFIALILVAAIAAAVIIGTAEDLEERGQEAAGDAKNVVKQTPRILRAEGEVATSGNIDNVDIYLDYIGSEGVDMRNVVLHVIATPNGGTAARADLTQNLNPTTTATATTFGTTEIADPLNHWDPAGTPPRYILGETTQLRVRISLSSAATVLPPDSSLRIEITTTDSGGRTIDEWETPSAYPSGGWVLLED
ncbi:hypothetical protein B6U90_01175 [Thermoplasmatales archaeon ex4484_6]|nr:MAG: hypothetical protein B6U90_01175 [Thermoplasmatales archaeon ex4484_6]RLF68698.1 MAG: hypothetical protein DRN57_03210 [Thermoplasmata archaeon]